MCRQPLAVTLPNRRRRLIASFDPNQHWPSRETFPLTVRFPSLITLLPGPRSNGHKRDEITAPQFHALREYQRPRERKLLLSDIKELLAN
jgi:hypothetical protein